VLLNWDRVAGLKLAALYDLCLSAELVVPVYRILSNKRRCLIITFNHSLGWQVWDFQRSAEMRDTEGGVSRRSVLEQVDKMRAYLAAVS
jgi:argininosuccinate lyase